MKRSIVVLGLLWITAGPAFAEPLASGQSGQPERAWYVTPKAGLSAFTGILGLEVQYKHLALDVGLPGDGGLRYYAHPGGHSWFGGLYSMGFSYDHDETKDGVAYTHYSVIQAGLGGGYRWFWRSRWTLELGITVGAGHQRWRNSTYERTERDIFFLPVAAVGVTF